MTRATAIRVWTSAGGRCCFPDCPNELKWGPKYILGQIAHIIAKKHTGPRGDPRFPRSKLDLPSNLMLLCAHHHALVDTDSASFSVADLRKIKRDHESQIAEALKSARPWMQPWHLIH